jgi:hypothetical protein
MRGLDESDDFEYRDSPIHLGHDPHKDPGLRRWNFDSCLFSLDFA